MTLSPVAWSSVLSVLSLLLVYVLPVAGSGISHGERSATVDGRPPLDKALLGIQIGSIAGAYGVFVAVLLALLLLVGRRLRRTVLSSNYSLHMEMLRPVKQSVSMDPSPISPISNNLPSPNKPGGFTASWGSLHRGPRPSQTSVNDSMVTVDESVVALDRQRAQDEMEMLYAAVMEHDAQKAAGVSVTGKDQDSQGLSPDSQRTNPFTDRHGFRISETPSMAPLKSPKTSRLSRLFSSNSRSTTNPDMGKLKSPRLNIRKQQISSPLGSPNTHPAHSQMQDNPPLSPRIYNPGPPPAIPRPGPTAGPTTGQVMPPPGRARAPAPLNLSPATQSSSNLPFREAYPLRSAPATKTTILERPVKNRNGPMTGMPTPYSPYMPFTPVTPFTPGRTVTKHQRRRQERENGLRVLNEDDLVKDDNDMWG